MSNLAALLFKGSKGTLRFRLKDALTEDLITDSGGVTVAATLKLAGVDVFSPASKSLTYSASAKLHADDDETGAWTCEVTAAELTSADDYVATFTVTISAATVHTTTLRVPVRIDTGRRSL